MKYNYRSITFIGYALLAFFALSVSPLNAQTAAFDEAHSEEYYSIYGEFEPEVPKFYSHQGSLSRIETHVIGVLTREERDLIEFNEYDCFAIGVYRALPAPIQFDLSKTLIPPYGETTVSGGRLTRFNDESLVWTTSFRSEGSDEIRIHITEGYFPDGVKVNLFSPDGSALHQYQLSGQVSEYGFYTTTAFADEVTMQVVVPLEVIGEPLYFTIAGLTHAELRYLEDYILSTCYEDAMCSEANLFAHIDNLRRSVARLTWTIGGTTYCVCSGSLLNDQRPQDYQPYLLTAEHCFNTQSSAAIIEATFDWRTTSCNGSNNTNTFQVVGSNLIATNSQSDFTLVLLHAKPGGSRSYAGWTTTNPSNNDILHSVHHPACLRQKYTRAQNKTSPSPVCTSGTDHFHYTRVQVGQTLGGSSGSPIVQSNGQIVGQLLGKCPGPTNHCDFTSYHNVWGKFRSSYLNNNLQFWLGSSPGAQVAMSTSPVSNLNFGTRDVGSQTTFNVTVTNTGTRPNFLNLEAGPVTITGTNASQFSIVGSTSLYLPPGASGTFQVRFSPTSNGYKTATLNIPHNADNIASPRTITLNGDGNPCSDAVNLNNGGVANAGVFSRSGTGSWHTSVASACGFTCPGRERLFYFTAPYTGTYQLHVTSTNSTWVNYMYRSGSCSSTGWTCISDVFNPGVYGSMALTAGTTYYILLDSETTALTTHYFYIGMPGRWEGTLGNNWETANNWYNGIVPDETTDVRIISGKPNQPVIEGTTPAQCRNLIVGSGATLTMNSTSYLRIHGTVFDPAFGQFIMNGTTSFLYFDGSLNNIWYNDYGNDIYTNVRVDKDVNSATTTMLHNISCSGTFQIWNGTLTLNSNRTLTSTSTSATAFQVQSNGILNLADGQSIETTGGIQFLNGSSANVTGGTFLCGGRFRIDDNTSTNIQLTNATVVLNGTGNQLLQDLDGNSIHHLTIDKPSGSATIDLANLSISGNLTIDNGTFNLGSQTCNVAGTTNINNGGTLAMNNVGNNLTTPVISWNSGSNTNIAAGTFNVSNIWDFKAGTNAQIGPGNTAYVNNMYFPSDPDAHFGNLVVSPGGVMLSGELRTTYPVNVAGNLTIKNGANWAFPGPSGMIVSGNSLIESGASLSFNSNAVFNTAASLNISGTLNLSSGSSALLNGALIFPSTGLLSIAGGSFINDLPDTDAWTNIHGTLNMSSGLFELSNNHPRFFATAATNISGGVFRIGGSFSVANPGIFQPTGGTFEISGNNANGYIYFNTGNNFHNLVVNRGPIAFSHFVTSDPVAVQNNFIVENGMFRTGSVAVSVQGNAAINTDGILVLDGVGSLLMGASKSLTVNNGGLLELNGTITDQPKISRISSGNYAFNIESGGTIRAEYALFEYMNTSGVNIKPGAIVDHSKAFHYCTFRNGQSGGRLMTINNNQTFAVNYASFPNNTWGGNYNVYKTANAGVVTFGGFSGLFSGEANEWDPYNRIHWGGEIAPNVTLEGVNVASGQEICFEATNTLTVGGGGSTFVVQNGGNANLVAGQKIVMLEGTRVFSGGYLHARITTTSDYCSLPAALLAVLEEKQSTNELVADSDPGEGFFKVYPNPTTGRFTLELSEIASTVTVEIYGVMGEQILRQEVSGFMMYEFDLSTQARGIYIVRVLNGDKMEIQRVIRQ